METLKTRCPSCSKLYVVEKQDIVSEVPQFKCQTCEVHFAFKMPDFVDELESEQEVESFVIPWQSMPEFIEENDAIGQEASLPVENVEAGIDCPKCGFKNSLVAEECRKCGVVLRKAEEILKHGFRSSEVAQHKWQAVMMDYENEELHAEFVKICQVEGCLPFAAYRYQSILDADPTEEIALKMKQQVLVLAKTSVEFSRESFWDFHSLRENVYFMMSLVLVMVLLSALLPNATIFRFLGAIFSAYSLYLVLRKRIGTTAD